MDIKKIEKDFNYRFKFEATELNMDTYDAIVSFKDTYDEKFYKIEMSTAILLETILENIIKEKRDTKIVGILK
jgi:hypothetical protein